MQPLRMRRDYGEQDDHNGYLNTPPTSLAVKMVMEKDPKKKAEMEEALMAWRITQPNPTRRENVLGCLMSQYPKNFNSMKTAAAEAPKYILFRHYDRLYKTARFADEEARDIVREARDLVAMAPVSFFMELARNTGISLKSIVDIFKNPTVVRFFSKIGWSFKKLADMLKKGMTAARELSKAIEDFVAYNKVTKWTVENLHALDGYLEKHKVARYLSGAGMAALLLFLYFSVTFIGDADWDFDLSDVVDALAGKYSLGNLFHSGEGVKLLTAFTYGQLNLSGYPFEMSNVALLAIGVIRVIANELSKRLVPSKEDVELQAEELRLV